MSNFNVTAQNSSDFRGRSNTWCGTDSKNHSNAAISGHIPQKQGRRNNVWGGHSYSDLITRAILTSPNKRLTLIEIYTWMVEHVPIFTEENALTWKNSIRHNLSYRNQFTKVENKGSKGYFWTVDLSVKTNKTSKKRVSAANKANPKVYEAVSQLQINPSQNYVSTITASHVESNLEEQFNKQLSLPQYPSQMQYDNSLSDVQLPSSQHVQHVQYNNRLPNFQSTFLQYSPRITYNVSPPNLESSFPEYCPQVSFNNSLLPQHPPHVPYNTSLPNFESASTSSYSSDHNQPSFQGYHNMGSYRDRSYSNSSYYSDSSSPDQVNVIRNNPYFSQQFERYDSNEMNWHNCATGSRPIQNFNYAGTSNSRPRSFSNCSIMDRQIASMLEERICEIPSVEESLQNIQCNDLLNDFQ